MKNVEDLSERDLKSIVDQYDFGELHRYKKIDGGSTPCAMIQTTSGNYFVKYIDKSITDERMINFTNHVMLSLSSLKIKQPVIYKTINGSLLSTKGCMVFDYLEGSSETYISENHIQSVFTYLARYNSGLGHLTVPAWIGEFANHWDRADSLTYLLDDFAPHMDNKPIVDKVTEVLADAFKILNGHRSELEALPRQLIHGDLGGNNIIRSDKASTSPVVIDLTPYHENHLYSICVPIYWAYIYFAKKENIEFENISEALDAYNQQFRLAEDEKSLFFELIVKVACRMVVVMILFDLDSIKSQVKPFIKFSQPISTVHALKKILLEKDKITSIINF
ncbi:MAG: phosphotransferase [Candidatus Heimdallarchaeota archaeon]|nr:phosphotransferase [Candidatus Heimdallarchaeota archaeon]